MSGPKKHALLDSIQARFQQQNEERQKQVERLQAKREAEVFHSRYLKQHVVDPTKIANAKFVVDQWAKKHGTAVEKHIKQAVKHKSETPRRRQVSLDRAQHGGLQNQANIKSPQQVRRTRNRISVDRTDTRRSNRNSRHGFCARDISESDGNLFDESISLGTCIREFNKHTAVSKPVLPPVICGQNTDRSLTQRNDMTNSDKDATHSVKSCSNTIKGEILINDDLSVVSVDNLDMAVDPLTLDSKTFASATPDSLTSAPVTASLSGTMCCVVNCGADFSTKSGILEHEANFDHSPCNPLLLTKDCCLPTTSLGYACPKCLQVFKTVSCCVEHQKSVTDHLSFLLPLDVAAYLCPQCLALFPSYQCCQSHIDDLNHQRVAYPFNGDVRSEGKNLPIPVSRALAEDFLTRCRFVSFSVSCLDCTLIIKSNSEMVEHLQDTDYQHWHFIATSTLEQVDVFLKYLESHACSTCDSVMSPPISDDNIHYCISNDTESMIGQIQNIDCQTFRDFVRRCCISFMVSQDVNITKKFPGQDMHSPEWSSTCRKRKHSSDSDCGKKIKVKSSFSDDMTTEQMSISVPNEQHNQMISETFSNKNSWQLAKINFQQLPTGQMKNIDTNSGLDQDFMENFRISTADGQYQEGFDLANKSLIAPANLNKMINIIFVNLDVWPYFFKRLPLSLPSSTFVWGFSGKNGTWKEPHSCDVYDHQRRNGRFYFNPPCGHHEDAADFALCLTYGRMDERLDKCVHFTILSGDHAYQELDRQKEKLDRTVVLIDPSDAHQWTDYTILYTIISSVSDQ